MMANALKRPSAAPETIHEAPKTAEKGGEGLRIQAINVGELGVDTAGESGDGGGEKASENKRDNNGAAARTSQTQQTATAIAQVFSRPLPSIRVMEKRIETQIRTEIVTLLTEIKKLDGKPYEQAEKLREVRKLERSLKDLAKMALEAIKEWYLKLFGKQHGGEIEAANDPEFANA